MSEPYIGEIRIMAFNYAPRNWAFCDGSSIPTTQNPTLFATIGTNFGGEGRMLFKLPDLRGRSGMGTGTGPNSGHYSIGFPGGAEAVSLTTPQLPSHSHSFHCTTEAAKVSRPKFKVYADGKVPIFTTSLDDTSTMNSGSLAAAGSGLAHENMQPSLVVNYCIAINGLYLRRGG